MFKGACIRNRLEKNIPNIEYSQAYIDKYKYLFEGFEGFKKITKILMYQHFY